MNSKRQAKGKLGCVTLNLSDIEEIKDVWSQREI